MKEVAINVQESLNLYNYLNKFIIWIFLFVIFFLSSGFALTVNEGTVFQTSNNSINYITAEDLTYLSNIDISENNITFQSNNGSVFYNKNESFVDYFLHDVLINFKSNLTERNIPG